MHAKGTCDRGRFGFIMLAKSKREDMMAWTTPVLVEICVGLEINGYLPPEF
jgi:coenzyme PQQ precursor peptide PqqA